MPDRLRRAAARACCVALLCLAVSPGVAQTLAHRNWQGSGMAAEPWWRSAVFYRIEPDNFQDSSGAGHGDLKGIAERMSYLRALGIDAIVLQPPFDEDDSAGFDALLAAASESRIRLVVGVRNDPAVNPIARGRAWLARGAAGLEVEATEASSPLLSDTLTALHAAARGYPGERVVMAAVNPATAAQLHTQRGAGADLVTVNVDSIARRDNSPSTLANSLRQSLLGSQGLAGPPTPVFFSDDATRSASVFAPATPTEGRESALARNATLAAVLLAGQAGAVSLLYGQELGLEGTEAPVRMQWTPSNVTPATWKPEDQRAQEEAEEAAAHPAPAPPRPAYNANVYGVYHPYVPPPRQPAGPAPFNPNALRGFTTRADVLSGDAFLPAGPDAPRSVALEERDDRSLLSFYRRLVALHHDNPVLRSGAVRVFDHDAQNALVWVRLPPTGIATAHAVVVVCNLGDTPLTLSLDDDLRQLRLRAFGLRRLASSPPELFASPSHLTLPAHAVYLGELTR